MESFSIAIPLVLAALISISMGLLFLMSRVSELPLPHALVTPTGGNVRGLAVIVSGARGWLRFDQRLAELLSEAGLEVIGLDSLRYFFLKRKKPVILSSDLERVIREKSPENLELVFIGNSKGADVLPFAVNLLPADLRGRIRLVALLGVARLASFQLRLGNIFSENRHGPYPLQVSPEIRKLEGVPGLCIYGDKDRVSLCRNLKRISSIEIREIQSGPMIQDAELVAQMILEKIQPSSQDNPDSFLPETHPAISEPQLPGLT